MSRADIAAVNRQFEDAAARETLTDSPPFTHTTQ
jgi:hypothetical protein